MIKRTLYFGNPAYLSKKLSQLVINIPGAKGMDDKVGTNTIPIEDIGVVILDNRQITITTGLMESLLENNCAIISCNSNRMPIGLMLPLDGNTLQNERFRAQVDSSLPLQKQLWQQTIEAKIENQISALKKATSVEVGNMEKWAKSVKSGDPDNYEARAAVYYWANIFPQITKFKRDRDGLAPNNILNYGYSILRAVVARSLVGSGLLPTLGIHHHNKYNAYCLADDIMEPYRPFVDMLVIDIMNSGVDYQEITTDIKIKLLNIPVLDININGQRSPLMVGVTQTTASLYKCYKGESRKIIYPVL